MLQLQLCQVCFCFFTVYLLGSNPGIYVIMTEGIMKQTENYLFVLGLTKAELDRIIPLLRYSYLKTVFFLNPLSACIY